VTDHAYVDGHYLTITSDDRRSALVFETDGVKVTSFRVGKLPRRGGSRAVVEAASHV
jgi:hypothetical protein